MKLLNLAKNRISCVIVNIKSKHNMLIAETNNLVIFL